MDRLEAQHDRYFLSAFQPTPMPRVLVIPVSLPAPYTSIGAALEWVEISAGDGSGVLIPSGHVLVLIRNTDTVQRMVTIQSAPDPYGRYGDHKDYPIAPGAFEGFGPFVPVGWKQPDAQIYVDADAPGVQLAAIAL